MNLTFQMFAYLDAKNEQSRDLTRALGGLASTSANDWHCLSFLCDVIQQKRVHRLQPIFVQHFLCFDFHFCVISLLISLGQLDNDKGK